MALYDRNFAYISLRRTYNDVLRISLVRELKYV